MKLLGLSFGTKLGNNEIMVKEALMEAEKAGIEVGFIRMMDLDIKPCKGCIACVMSLREGGDGRCSIKDDLKLVDEQLMDSDAVIFSAPVYVLGPQGLVKVVADRWGPSHDVYWRMEAKKIAQIKGKKGPDERSFKNRVGAIMVTGGASTQHWLSLGLPMMHLLAYPSRIRVIDQLQYMSMSKTGHAVLNNDVLVRARKLGKNIADAMNKPVSELKWMAEDAGMCPVCHGYMFTLAKQNPVECPICGIKGELKVTNGKISVSFDKNELEHSRLNLGGLKDHWDELALNSGSMSMAERIKRMEETKKRSQKYEGYKELKLK